MSQNICKTCGTEMEYDPKSEVSVCNICHYSQVPIEKGLKILGLNPDGTPPDLSKIKMKEIKKVSNAINDAKKRFHCNIKGREISMMDCFKCFDSPEEDGTCSIMQEQMKANISKRKGGKAQLREKLKKQKMERENLKNDN
jgi:hypothetical protein